MLTALRIDSRQGELIQQQERVRQLTAEISRLSVVAHTLPELEERRSHIRQDASLSGEPGDIDAYSYALQLQQTARQQPGLRVNAEVQATSSAPQIQIHAHTIGRSIHPLLYLLQKFECQHGITPIERVWLRQELPHWSLTLELPHE
ncbi:hypothetical protein [Spirochaeta africana]|nr:hypothetical protein [Spirochaeta africana]